MLFLPVLLAFLAGAHAGVPLVDLKPTDHQIRCGDQVAIRLADGGWWGTDRSGGASANFQHIYSGQNVFTLKCKNNKDGDVCPLEESVRLISLAKQELADPVGHDNDVALQDRKNTKNAWFDLLTPDNVNDREPLTNGAPIILRSTTFHTDTVVAAEPKRKDKLRMELFNFDYSSGRLEAKNKKGMAQVFLACPLVDGRLCNNKGWCRAGKCDCLAQYEGHDCRSKKEFASCAAVGDPHWTDFDGFRFNLYDKGEFLQYYDPKGDGKEAVTGRFVPYKHNPRAAVHQGVSVRRNNEFVRIEFVPNRQSNIYVNCKKVSVPTTTKEGLKIWCSNGRTCHVESKATSMRVNVANYDWGQNFWMRAYTQKDGHLRGLCGNFDGNWRDNAGYPYMNWGWQAGVAYVRGVVIPAKHSLFHCNAKKGNNLDYFLQNDASEQDIRIEPHSGTDKDGTTELITMGDSAAAGAHAQTMTAAQAKVRAAEDKAAEKCDENLLASTTRLETKLLNGDSLKELDAALQKCPENHSCSARIICGAKILLGKSKVYTTYPDCVFDECQTDDDAGLADADEDAGAEENEEKQEVATAEAEKEDEQKKGEVKLVKQTTEFETEQKALEKKRDD